MQKTIFFFLLFIIPFIHLSPIELPRKGTEIVACGRFFDINTTVVTWMDPGGYDAYRVECRFTKFNESSFEKCKGQNTSPNRFGIRPVKDEETREKIRGGGWTLPILQEYVDKFVIHFDVAVYSKNCFKILHDMRFLSVHFLLDVDGTIYQTLDLKEMGWHATIANPMSIGVEIAHIGTAPASAKDPFSKWYKMDEKGPRLVLPPDAWVRTPNFIGRPIRPTTIIGEIQGTKYQQYDFTKEQYDALIKLTAGLSKIFPKIKLQYPKDQNGLIRKVLPQEQFYKYQGVLGHYHVQANKNDPGPAFQWDMVIEGAKKLVQKK